MNLLTIYVSAPERLDPAVDLEETTTSVLEKAGGTGAGPPLGFQVLALPALFADGETVAVVLTGSEEEIRGVTQLLEEAGLHVDRGDQPFGLHQPPRRES